MGTRTELSDMCLLLLPGSQAVERRFRELEASAYRATVFTAEADVKGLFMDASI